VDLEVLDGSGLLQGEGDFPVAQGRDAVVVDDDDVPEVGQLVEDLADLGGVLLWVMTAEVSAFESRTRSDSSRRPRTAAGRWPPS
jgi:hypothetical protein